MVNETAGVIDVSRPTSERTLVQAVSSFLGAVAAALLIPLAILVVGLPVALAVRALLELIGWFR